MMDMLTRDLSPIDSGQVQHSLHEERILKDGEKVEMAFQCGRDQLAFTCKRILHVDRQGLTGKRIEYQSTPYQAIKAFSVETAGGAMDRDTELIVFTDLTYMPRHKFTFNKNNSSVHQLHHYMMHKVLDKGGVHSAVSASEGSSGVATVASWLTGDARQISATEVEASLKTKELPVLLHDEVVVLAFKSGRDSLLLTDRRYLKIDVQGISGTRVEYLSIPYTSIHAFAVRTAGAFLDVDAELMVWTGLPTSTGMFEISQRLLKGASDIFAVQQFMAGQVLGSESAPPAHLGQGTAVGKTDTFDSFMSFLQHEAARADPRQAEQMLQTTPTPILLPHEHVDLAYTVRSDWLVLTTKRMLWVDTQKVLFGMGGKNIEYKSLLYSAIGSFAVQTAGNFDGDVELKIWTDIHPPPQPGGDPPPPPPPGMAYHLQDLRSSNANVFGIIKVLTERALKIELGHMPTSAGTAQGPTGTVQGGLLSWMGGDCQQMDPKAIERHLRAAVPLLGDHEHITHAFQCGRDLLTFTPARIIFVDVTGWSGKRVEYRVLGFKALRGFHVESQGKYMDWDSELVVYTNLPWMAGFKLDVRKGSGNVFDIHKHLCHILLPKNVPPQSDPRAPKHEKGSKNPFAKAAAFLGQNASQIDASEVQSQLSNGDHPVLVDGEVAHLAFKVGRDTVVLTQLRLVKVDVKGMSGEKVQYQSVPWHRVHCFSVVAAHNIDHHVKIITDMPACTHVTFDLKKGEADIYEVQESLAKSVLI